MASDPAAAAAATGERAGSAGAAPVKRVRHTARNFSLLILAAIALAVAALILAPPFPKHGSPSEPCGLLDVACYIGGVVEPPPPAVVVDLAPAAESGDQPMVFFHPSISSTILTMWLIMALILLLAIAATRSMKVAPGRVQNAVEWLWELGRDFAVGIGGERARRYYPIFAGFFLLILFSNWSGLVPPIGKIEQLRAPTSDVNITIGLALTSFVVFQGEGFRRLGVRGYLGKFFPLGQFRHGVGAGLLAMYVGIVELFLEFVKPVTLAMRLFGNIYGGEVALAVIAALTSVLIVPAIPLMGLEALLNVIQALIFSVLTLMFILIAIEGHGEEDHEAPAGAQSKPAAA